MRLLLLSFCALSLLQGGDLSGRRAPSFNLSDFKGKFYDSLDFRGKPLIIEFMQSNCPHCSAFAKTLERINKKYAGRINILAVANRPDTPATLAEYIKNHGITSPVVLDLGTVAYSFMRKPEFDLPYVFLIDAGGIIRNDFGYSALNKSIFEGQGLDAEIDKLLAGGGAAKAPPKKK